VDVTWLQALHSSVTALVGTVALAIAVHGHFIAPARVHERLLLFVAALGLIDPGLLTDAVGVGSLALVYALQRARSRPGS
jgi:TRAP-type uncharacterized transport system fused permease subunit